MAEDVTALAVTDWQMEVVVMVDAEAVVAAAVVVAAAGRARRRTRTAARTVYARCKTTLRLPEYSRRGTTSRHGEADTAGHWVTVEVVAAAPVAAAVEARVVMVGRVVSVVEEARGGPAAAKYIGRTLCNANECRQPRWRRLGRRRQSCARS